MVEVVNEEKEPTGIGIVGGAFVPRKSEPIKNSDFLDYGLYTHSGQPIDDNFIFDRTQIKQRFHTQNISEEPANPDIIVPAMGYAALEKALKKKGWVVDDLDYLLVTTSYPISKSISEAVYEQSHPNTLKVPPSHLTLMDGYAACSGFVHWFHVINEAKQEFSGKKIAIVATEQYSIHVDGLDKAIFGDGAGAFIFTLDEDLEIMGTSYKHFGDSQNHLQMRLGPAPKGEQSIIAFYVPIPCPEVGDFKMNGNQVYRFITGKENSDVAHQAIENSGVSLGELRLIAIHQSNGKGIKNIENQLIEDGFLGEVPSNIDRYGNTSSASVPILLDEIIKQGKLKRGDRMLLWGMGAGRFSTAAVIKFL